MPIRASRPVSDSAWRTRPLEHDDWNAWRRLFTAYCAFYEKAATESQLQRVWSWIHHERAVEAILAVPSDGGEPVGLAHLRPWVRPLHGEVAGHLDDLFVEPGARGSGAVEALLTSISAMAAEKGWNVVRWTTADDNYRARAAYDRVATRTHWITYEMTPSPRGRPGAR